LRKTHCSAGTEAYLWKQRGKTPEAPRDLERKTQAINLDGRFALPLVADNTDVVEGMNTRSGGVYTSHRHTYPPQTLIGKELPRLIVHI
jgi:hypothetical protein